MTSSVTQRSYWSPEKLLIFREDTFGVAVITPVLVMIMVTADGQALLGASMMTSSNGNIFGVTGHLCGEFTGPGEFPAQRPVTRSFDVFFDLSLNKRLSKQSRGWWFETQSHPLWRHCNGISSGMVMSELTHLSLVTHMCINELGLHWFR